MVMVVVFALPADKQALEQRLPVFVGWVSGVVGPARTRKTCRARCVAEEGFDKTRVRGVDQPS